MRTMRRICLLILLAVFSVLMIAACGEEEVIVERLPAPENLRVREGRFLWNGVEGAVGYSVDVDGEKVDISGLFYDVADLTPLVEHILKVKANSDPNGALADSEWAELAYTPEERPTEGLKYTLDEKEYSVSKGSGTLSGRVVIPRRYDGYPVTKIKSSAFSKCTEITEVVLPDTIVSIEMNAFSGCENLEKINIPESVTSIEMNAFSDCENLEKINLPESVTSLGTAVFSGCKKLASITLPEGIETISAMMFRNCESLESITIPQSVKEIGTGAFRNCVKLNKMDLPNDRIEIAKGCLENTAILNNQPDGLVYLGSILLGYKGTMPEKAVINDIAPGTTTIVSNAFAVERNLDKIVIPDSVTYIGKGAFSTSGLSEVVLSKNLETIEAFTFTKTLLTRIEIPASVTKIGEKAFSNSQLQEIVFSEGLVEIGEEAFSGCVALERVEFPNSLETIGKRAFAGCGVRSSWAEYGLRSVKFGTNLKTIGEEAFYNCYQLETIEYTGTAVQWNSIKKLSHWDYAFQADIFSGTKGDYRRGYTVVCSDEELTIEAEEWLK